MTEKVNINKTVIKNTIKEAGIKQSSPQAIENLVSRFLRQTKVIADECKNVLNEQKKEKLTPEILDKAIENLTE